MERDLPSQLYTLMAAEESQTEALTGDLVEQLHERNIIKSKFSKLNAIHQLQKSIVRQKMHNVMSPLSFISGYLELLNSKLQYGTDIHKIESYRSKIEEGVRKVNNILQQLQAVYGEDTDVDMEDNRLHIELRWLVHEIGQQMQSVYPNLRIRESGEAMHICADLFVTKLVILNLINNVVKSSTESNEIWLSLERQNSYGSVRLDFSATEDRKRRIEEIVTTYPVFDERCPNCEDSFNRGLAISGWLVREIGGELKLHEIDSGKAQLRLNLPLSDGTN